MPDPTATASPPLDVTKTHVARELKHDRPLISCRFDPTGRFVFAGAQDNKIVRWDLTTGTKTELLAHDSWVRALAFVKQREGDTEVITFISGGNDGRMIWWPAAADKPEPIRKIDAHRGWVRALAVTPDQTQFASAGNDNLVKTWRPDGTFVREFVGHAQHVYNVVIHSDGKQLVSGDLKANVIHWDLETGQQVRQFRAASLHKYDETFWADIGGYRGLVFSPDGKWLMGSGITNVSNAFAGIGNPAVAAFDWAAGQEKVVHVAKTAVQGSAWGVVCLPECLVGLSGGGGGGVLYFWKYGEKNEFHLFKLPNTARDLSLSPDGRHLATAHFDGNLRISLMAAKT